MSPLREGNWAALHTTIYVPLLIAYVLHERMGFLFLSVHCVFISFPIPLAGVVHIFLVLFFFFSCISTFIGNVEYPLKVRTAALAFVIDLLMHHLKTTSSSKQNDFF